VRWEFKLVSLCDFVCVCAYDCLMVCACVCARVSVSMKELFCKHEWKVEWHVSV